MSVTIYLDVCLPSFQPHKSKVKSTPPLFHCIWSEVVDDDDEHDWCENSELSLSILLARKASEARGATLSCVGTHVSTPLYLLDCLSLSPLPLHK